MIDLEERLAVFLAFNSFKRNFLIYRVQFMEDKHFPSVLVYSLDKGKLYINV